MQLPPNPPIRRPLAWVPYGFLCLFLGFCLFTFRKDFEKVEFSAIPSLPGLYLLVVVMSLASYVIRAIRWRAYLQYSGFLMPFWFAVVTYLAGFAYTLAPGKVGELLKFRYYHPLKIDFSPVAATFLVERMTDLAVFVFIALFFWGMTTQGYGLVVLLSGLCVPIAFAGIGLLDASFLAKVGSRIPDRYARASQFFSRVGVAIQSARSLLTVPRLSQGFFLGACAWFCEAATLYALAYMYPDVGLPLTSAIGIYAVAIVVGAVSFLPGGLGGTEAALMALLIHHGYSFEQSAILTAICRLLTLWVAVAVGWVAVLILKIRKDPE